MRERMPHDWGWGRHLCDEATRRGRSGRFDLRLNRCASASYDRRWGYLSTAKQKATNGAWVNDETTFLLQQFEGGRGDGRNETLPRGDGRNVCDW